MLLVLSSSIPWKAVHATEMNWLLCLSYLSSRHSGFSSIVERPFKRKTSVLKQAEYCLCPFWMANGLSSVPESPFDRISSVSQAVHDVAQ
ncbi:hypothetical protein F5146DRAFT_253614 [Armillaria mellea]|nr:hypothetical protein F5146DRAFT_253614 [Armillaria mellea]